MKRYILVSFLRPGVPAAFTKAEWPLHVTVLQTFETSLPEGEIGRIVAEACDRQAPIDVVGKSREMFGPDKDTPVTELALPDSLARFRESLRRALEGSVAYADRLYPTYRPHVTDHCGEALAVGQAAKLCSISVVERTESGFAVAGTFPLNGTVRH